LAMVSGAVLIGRDSSALPAGALASFTGVNTAVNAISPLAGSAIDGAGAGNSGVPIAALGPPGAGENGVTAGATDVAGAATNTTIAVTGGISATLRNCFRESVSKRRAAAGAGEDPDVELPNIERIIDSAICADDAGVAGCVAGSARAGIVIEAGEGLVDSDDVLLNIDVIIESATCVPDSTAAGIVVEAGGELIDSDDVPPNIDLIIESATCAGDAVVTGLFTVFATA